MGMLPREAGSSRYRSPFPGGAGPVEPVGSYDDSDAWGWGVAVAGDLVFVSHGDGYVQLIDVDRSCISQLAGTCTRRSESRM